MSLKTELENSLKQALRSGDEVRKRVIRMALAAIKLSEVEKGKSLDDAMVISVLQKELKAREETIAEAEKAGRTDLITENQAEIAVLREFLPQPLSQAELEAVAQQAIERLGLHLHPIWVK
jgi:uncharacterized protein YqeY